ncbi:transcriptional regulator GutM [Enterococcus faecium]
MAGGESFYARFNHFRNTYYRRSGVTQSLSNPLHNAFMNKLIKRYDTCPGYTLTTEVEKNCISSVVLVVITDSQDTIIEAYIYAGLTIFSQFKPCDVLTGKTISQNLKNEIAKEKPSLKQRAIHSFLSKKMKSVT